MEQEEVGTAPEVDWHPMMTPPPTAHDEDREHGDNDREDEEKNKDYDINDYKEDDNVVSQAIKEEENSKDSEPLRNGLAKEEGGSDCDLELKVGVDSKLPKRTKITNSLNDLEEIYESVQEAFKLANTGIGETEDAGPMEVPRDTAQEDDIASDTKGIVRTSCWRSLPSRSLEQRSSTLPLTTTNTRTPLRRSVRLPKLPSSFLPRRSTTTTSPRQEVVLSLPRSSRRTAMPSGPRSSPLSSPRTRRA